MKQWVFGIDGGGTSSRIKVESLNGECLYKGKGGSTNPNAKSQNDIINEIKTLLYNTFCSGFEAEACLSGYISSAGVDRPDDKEKMNLIIKESFNQAVCDYSKNLNKESKIEHYPIFGSGNDAEAALVGAVGSKEGFLLIAGTGSIAYARNQDGKVARSGGWGHFLGDEGSAFWIAFEAIKLGIRSVENRDKKSILMREILNFFHLKNPQELIPFTYNNFSKAQIASFAPQVVKLAEEGDLLAKTIIEKVPVELCALVKSVYQVLGDSINNKKLALYGGILEHNESIKKRLISSLSIETPKLEVINPINDAQTGACFLAKNLLTK